MEYIKMNFADIFKASFLSDFTVDMTTTAIAVYLAVTAVIGFYIFLVYRIITKKSFYNKNFNISLWVLTLITASIIITISSNIVLSLGMVGALSIVRYRTAVKDPMDLAFLFWAIAEGIICGAGMTVVGVILAVVITVGLLGLNKLPVSNNMKIMTLSASNYHCEDAVMETVKKHCKRFKVKSRTLSSGQLNLVIEFHCNDEKECTDSLVKIEGVHSVATLAHDGEVTF